jgi:hypothetical protein
LDAVNHSLNAADLLHGGSDTSVLDDGQKGVVRLSWITAVPPRRPWHTVPLSFMKANSLRLAAPIIRIPTGILPGSPFESPQD